MLRKLVLTALLCFGLFVFSETKAQAGVGRYCWWCGSDSCIGQDIKGISGNAVKNGTATGECTVVDQVEPVALCKNPQGHLVRGESSREGPVTFSEILDSICPVKINGRCAVEVHIPTQPKDFEPLITTCDPLVVSGVQACDCATDDAQSCFEKFWGTTCNNNFVAFAIFFPDPQIDIKFFDRDRLKDRIQATCHYPFDEIQFEPNGDLKPVLVQCQ